MTHWLIFVEFIALALVIGVSGYFLSLYGDVIAEKTGLGGTWVGMAVSSRSRFHMSEIPIKKMPR